MTKDEIHHIILDSFLNCKDASEEILKIHNDEKDSIIHVCTGLILGLLFILFCATLHPQAAKVKEQTRYIPVIQIDTELVDKYTMRDAMLRMGILEPNGFTKLSVWETGNYNSHIFLKKNNCFGFSNGKDFLSFSSINVCLAFLRRFQSKYYECGDFSAWVDKYHWTHSDSSYSTKLKQINI